MRRGPQVQILLVYVDGWVTGFRPRLCHIPGVSGTVRWNMLNDWSRDGTIPESNELLYVQDTQIFVLGDGERSFTELYHDPQRTWIKIADV